MYGMRWRSEVSCTFITCRCPLAGDEGGRHRLDGENNIPEQINEPLTKYTLWV